MMDGFIFFSHQVCCPNLSLSHGDLGHECFNRFTDTRKVLENVVIGKSQDLQTVVFEFVGSFGIVGLSLGSEVTFSVDFDDEFEFGAVEVHDEVVDGTLAEDTIFAGAEVAMPEFVFSGGGVFAEFFGAIDEVAVVGKVDGVGHGWDGAEWV